ncbi:MAG: hypothetical protein KDC87_19680 [Planctomycetes bacterium]|nr:hypothetical protein [Planctomycetota bacterium]MCB9889657.1 hypothetical protein [Planctomycetota bacterium]
MDGPSRHRLGVYLHPDDLTWLEQRGGLPALRALGCTDVAFAASYHAGRWTTPVPGGSLVRFLEDGVVYFRPGDDYEELRPHRHSSVPPTGATPFDRCIDAARAAGLECHAWTVLFHNSPLGRAHRESCVENAVGDHYEYSLCPARPEVQAFGARLVRDVAAHPGLDVVEVEAMGFLGYRHGSHHDKRSIAPDPYLDFLLSYCFCEHCLAGLQGNLVDGTAVRRMVADLLHQQLVDGDAMEPQQLGWQQSFDRLAAALGRRSLLGMLRHRTLVYTGLLASLRAQLPAGVRLSVHLNMDPLFSGSQLGLPFDAVTGHVDEIVVTHYGETPTRMAEMWRGQQGRGARTRVAIWPKAPEFTTDRDLIAVLNLVEEWHLDGVRVYHPALLPWRTVERVLRVLSS